MKIKQEEEFNEAFVLRQITDSLRKVQKFSPRSTAKLMLLHYTSVVLNKAAKNRSEFTVEYAEDF